MLLQERSAQIGHDRDTGTVIASVAIVSTAQMAERTWVVGRNKREMCDSVVSIEGQAFTDPRDPPYVRVGIVAHV